MQTVAATARSQLNDELSVSYCTAPVPTSLNPAHDDTMRSGSHLPEFYTHVFVNAKSRPHK